MNTYPAVLSEADTLAEVVNGLSLARYGDGEFNLCVGKPAKRQQFDRGLQSRLCGILRASGTCLVGIPNILSPTPKAAFWDRYKPYASLLADRPYGSAFISRPDSAPWINSPAYWTQLSRLWVETDVTLVRGSASSLSADDLIGVGKVVELTAPMADAWAEYPRLLERIKYLRPERVLICLGPTATVLAVDLAAHGIHAIDLGHVALFLRKYRRGEPMTLTAAEKAHGDKAVTV